MLFVLQGLLLGFLQQLGALTEESLVVKDAGEVDLLAQLHRDRALHVQQPDADQNLLVEMGLHVGELFLLDRAALQHPRLVVLLHRVHAVEQRDELGLLITRQTGRIELEITLLRLAHAPHQIEYGLLLSTYATHLRLAV